MQHNGSALEIVSYAPLTLLGVTSMWWFCWNLDTAAKEIRDVYVRWHRWWVAWLTGRRIRRAERRLDYQVTGAPFPRAASRG